MAKKKRWKAGGSKNVRQMPNWAGRLVESLRPWSRKQGLDPDDVWIIESLMELTRDYLDIADPTVWPERETYELLTRVLPRKVHVPAEDRQLIAPTFGQFLIYLHDQGHWSPQSLPFEDVPDLVAELTLDVPEALGDPANRGTAGNIVDLALSQGVDLSDETQMAAFMERFNAMDDDARRQITDAGQTRGSAVRLGTAGGGPAGGGPAGGGPGAALGVPPGRAVRTS